MTTPDERTRSLLQAGAFLKELQADDSLPQWVQKDAYRLLRHFPSMGNVQLLAEIEQRFMGGNLLTTEIDGDWFKEYRFGPHTDQ